VFVRPGELRTARWEDIDLTRKEWVFEYSKQRANKTDKRTLIVPLSRQALAILKDLHPVTGDGVCVFPGMRSGRPISEVTINRALQGMGYNTETEMCAHGFRAMARTLLAEQLRSGLKGSCRTGLERAWANLTTGRSSLTTGGR